MASSDLIPQQKLILEELNQTAADPLAPMIKTIWNLYAAHAAIAPELQYLYSRRHCIIYLLGQTAANVDVTLGSDRILQSQQYAMLLKMEQLTDTQIARILARARAQRAAAAGGISATAPEQVSPGGADPADTAYSGDPQKPLRAQDL
ncbi:MAG: hypothetical protein KGJ62_15185 [Armatimonadetes bacterium]|nr:hypothetical protein [Armatimonadota bacterium]MDE2206290.1 hypothetical protein [Armatimonadota bacterium]